MVVICMLLLFVGVGCTSQARERMMENFYAYAETLPDSSAPRRINTIPETPDITVGGNWRDVDRTLEWGPGPDGYWYDRPAYDRGSGQIHHQGSSTYTRGD